MSRKYLQELIKSLREFHNCPSCSTNYHLDDIKFLGELEPYCFVQLSCHECSLPVLATISSNGKSSVKPLSDLSQTEEDKFEGKGEITSEEIAEFHRFISTFRGRIKLSKD